ncbi:MAG: hypothetical protein DHS20C21_05270 [Gemmatimonadota bacterium]|nr:MAG: hypothetical protein DHS20C21_05270 [Gemmatimonadota bacterium]
MASTTEAALREISALSDRGTLRETFILIDVMIPHGDQLGPAETENGHSTGLVLYDKIRELAPDCEVAFLTHRTDPAVERHMSGDRHARVFVKTDWLFSDIAEYVIERRAQAKQRVELEARDE